MQVKIASKMYWYNVVAEKYFAVLPTLKIVLLKFNNIIKQFYVQ